jgi:hypothetical protein
MLDTNAECDIVTGLNFENLENRGRTVSLLEYLNILTTPFMFFPHLTRAATRGSSAPPLPSRPLPSRPLPSPPNHSRRESPSWLGGNGGHHRVVPEVGSFWRFGAEPLSAMSRQRHGFSRCSGCSIWRHRWIRAMSGCTKCVDRVDAN